jgi:hypothetical protein
MCGVCDLTIPSLIPLSKAKFFTIAISYGRLRRRRETRVGNLRLAMAGYGSLVSLTDVHITYHGMSQPLPIKLSVKTESMVTWDHHTIEFALPIGERTTFNERRQTRKRRRSLL